MLDYLVSRGLEPLARNWQRRLGELDLVLRERTPDGPVTVFVEVRYRRYAAFGGGLASVDVGKRARLRRAARAWLQRHGDPDDIARIDVVAVGPDAGSPRAGRPNADRPDPAVRNPGDGEPRAGEVVPLGADADGRPLILEWVVNAVEDGD